MARQLPYMSRGSWIVAAVIMAYALLTGFFSYEFRPASDWLQRELKANQGTLRQTAVETNLLAQRAGRFVEKSVGAAFGALLIAFVYTAVRLRRLDERIAILEGIRHAEEGPGGTTAAGVPPA